MKNNCFLVFCDKGKTIRDMEQGRGEWLMLKTMGDCGVTVPTFATKGNYIRDMLFEVVSFGD